ncbi:MAG TPA: four helix bundle protein [Vicinamibacterales bacterium]|nr:four helix bundle protein [Vicinamibacterales bacterium]
MKITSYRDLDAWQLSMDLVEAVYTMTKLLPREELFGLSMQVRRAAVGIPSNVSEGHQHKGRAYRRYVVIALGCQAECETQLELIHRLKVAPRRDVAAVMELASRVGQVLHGLARSLKKSTGSNQDHREAGTRTGSGEA